MKDFVLKTIWPLTIISLAIISIIVAWILSAWLSFLVSFLIGLLLFFILLGVLLTKAVVSVPERLNYILTFFGKYQTSLKPGFNLVYPWFKMFKLPTAYNIAEHSIDVFEDAKGDPDEMVEFKESAAWVKLSVRLRVRNTEKAFTNVEDVYREIKDIFKKRFRDYAEDKDVLDFKDQEDPDNPTGRVDEVDLFALFGDDYKTDPNNIIQYIESEWGVEIIIVRLEDVILSKADREAREKVYAERNELAVVVLKNKQTVAKAKAEAAKIVEIAKAKRDSHKLEGTGLKTALKKITESNLSPVEASNFLQALKKWEAVPEVETGFFSDSQTSGGSGAGMSKQAIAEIIAISNEISKKNKRKEEKCKNQDQPTK